jgi:hypothetical protein
MSIDHQHTTSHILMVRPVNFTFNEQTAVNNAFQQAGHSSDAAEKAQQEFDAFVMLLRANQVDVTVVNDTPDPHTPDSIFPNNWISFHTNGTVVLYPMFAHNRRLERKPGVMETINRSFVPGQVIDLTYFEEDNKFLEGTGSMVLDRTNGVAYACLSPRTNPEVLDAFCSAAGYRPMIFHAVDEKGNAIYHTNVMMCVANTFVVICLSSIADLQERATIRTSIENSGKEVIDISFEQMNAFAGNMLQVQNASGESLLVMSSRAYHSLSREQENMLSNHNRIVHASLECIEKNGGGSARCMMAEIHLPIRL